MRAKTLIGRGGLSITARDANAISAACRLREDHSRNPESQCGIYRTDRCNLLPSDPVRARGRAALLIFLIAGITGFRAVSTNVTRKNPGVDSGKRRQVPREDRGKRSARMRNNEAHSCFDS